MPPRLNLLHVPRTLVVRSRGATKNWTGNGAATTQTRNYADAKRDLPLSEDKKGPNMDQELHVSEEAAAMAKTRGDTPPDISQGTPVEEVLKRDKEAQDKLPQVMKDSINAAKPSGSRSYSTIAIRRPWDKRHFSTKRVLNDLATSSVYSSSPFNPAIISSGLIPLTGVEKRRALKPRPRHLHDRLPNIIDQLTGLLIRDGKKGVAQRNVALILSHLRTAPPPKLDSKRLIAGHPPASHLPLNPVLYLTLAIDSVAPILRIKQLKGVAGGGMALPVPTPLGLRRRRWEAIHWILDSASKRKNRGSGKGMFAQRVAEEIVAVVEGKSSTWQRRDGLHKQATAARANMKTRSF